MLLYFSDRNGPKISFCKIKLKIFRLGFSHSAPLEQAKDKTQFFLLIFLAFVQHFFLLPYTPMKILMEYFCQEAVSSKKSQLVLKIRILLLFVMLESWLIWQIGCRICLWFQHNGEVINRIMDSKQGGSHVCFFLGGFQISQTECNAVFLSCGRKDQLAANSQRKRKAAPITGCEKLTFQNSRFKQPMGFVQLREGKCNRAAQLCLNEQVVHFTGGMHGVC